MRLGTPIAASVWMKLSSVERRAQRVQLACADRLAPSPHALYCRCARGEAPANH